MNWFDWLTFTAYPICFQQRPNQAPFINSASWTPPGRWNKGTGASDMFMLLPAGKHETPIRPPGGDYNAALRRIRT